MGSARTGVTVVVARLPKTSLKYLVTLVRENSMWVSGQRTSVIKALNTLLLEFQKKKMQRISYKLKKSTHFF
jgi:hypothetical protein